MQFYLHFNTNRNGWSLLKKNGNVTSNKGIFDSRNAAPKFVINKMQNWLTRTECPWRCLVILRVSYWKSCRSSMLFTVWKGRVLYWVEYGHKNLVNLLHKMTSGGVMPSNASFEIGAWVMFYFDENVGEARKGIVHTYLQLELVLNCARTAKNKMNIYSGFQGAPYLLFRM